MDEIFNRITGDLVGRLDGPFKFRFLLQPLMAILFAIRDGRKDAQAGREPYFWALLTEQSQRSGLLRECWDAMKKVFIVALLIDVIYQALVFRRIYLGEALVVAPVLAFIPYILFRGLVSRLLRSKSPTYLGRAMEDRQALTRVCSSITVSGARTVNGSRPSRPCGNHFDGQVAVPDSGSTGSRTDSQR